MGTVMGWLEHVFFSDEWTEIVGTCQEVGQDLRCGILVIVGSWEGIGGWG